MDFACPFVTAFLRGPPKMGFLLGFPLKAPSKKAGPVGFPDKRPPLRLSSAVGSISRPRGCCLGKAWSTAGSGTWRVWCDPRFLAQLRERLHISATNINSSWKGVGSGTRPNPSHNQNRSVLQRSVCRTTLQESQRRQTTPICGKGIVPYSPSSTRICLQNQLHVLKTRNDLFCCAPRVREVSCE